MGDRPRVAIAHDYLTQRGGAERVVLAMARAFPDAPIYTTLYEPSSTYPEFRDLDIRTSWLDRIPLFRKHHRLALPLLPLAASSLDIDADVVLASSSGWSHGFRHSHRMLVYCYSPARWLDEPTRDLGDDASALTRTVLALLSPGLRAWDRHAAESVDQYLAISTLTRDRIKRTYGRDSRVVTAPHTLGRNDEAGWERTPPQSGYYLVVSRLLPYKNVGVIVDAFRAMPERRLVVVGTGPQRDELRSGAPANVSFLEALSDGELGAVYRDCRALIAASHEDFGLTPLEANVYGKPAVVLRWGGFLDTVIEDLNGVFFDTPEVAAIRVAVDQVEAREWSTDVILEHARLFSEDVFAAALAREVSTVTAGA